MLSPRPLLALLLASALGAHAASVLHRDGWSFDRSDLIVYPDTDLDKKRAEGTLSGIGGWVDYDIEIAESGWHELWVKGAVANAARDVYLDGKPVLWLTTSQSEDSGDKGWLKECNLHLTAGKHTLRLKRWMYSPVLPSQWELRPSAGSAAGSVRVVDPGMSEARRSHNAVRVGDPVKLVIEGGRPGAATSYTLVARATDGSLTDLTTVDFPAGAKPLRREVSFSFAKQGAFLVLAREDGKLLRPADLKVGEYVAVDTKLPPVGASDTELRVRNVLDLDCTAAPPAGRFWEKDGSSRVVTTPAGRYRESSGLGSVAEWGTDGFSYKFDLPEIDALYRIRVEYPDNDRRSMGFWVTDGLGSTSNFTGVVNTGGVETGDHYLLSGRMLTHEAFFRPRANRDLVVAVLSFVPGLKAAAARIRIDLVESGLPPAPAGERGGRALGFYFEEPGRWLRFFGGNDRSPPEQIKTLERYGQWQRHIGSNLMFPTVQVYGGTHYPSRVLDGYMNTPLNETRLAALVAEKYGCRFVPELFLTGQMPFDSRTMGVRSYPDGKVEFTKPESAQIVLRDRDGKLKCFWKPFAYNPIHPAVQKLYIEAIGELADMLADTDSFAGISSRMMIGWQNQCWNSLPSLDWGYEDWTVAEFSRETGIALPGAPDDPARFRQRFEFLTGATMREKWMDWRSGRVFAFHQKLRDRIKQAKPSANLFFTYFPRDTPVEYSSDVLGRMREQAIDFARYEKEPGMQLVPGMTYGRRFSTPLSDAEGRDPAFDPQIKAIARSGMRAAGIFGLYFEVNKNLDWTQLGASAGLNAFDASVPAGRAELEAYSAALADSDSSFIITGGNGWMFGTPALMQPFLREYRALPAKPFDRFEKAVDPVAVWQHRDADGTLWFYAVNRLPVATTLELTLGGASPKVRPAAGGADLSLAGDRLSVALEPFALKTFRARSAELRDASVRTPEDYVAGLRSQLTEAARLRDDIRVRRLAPEASLADATEAVLQIDAAEAAFVKGEYWFARSQLERTAVIRLSYASGRYVQGLMSRSTPLGVPNFSDAAPKDLRVEWSDAPADLGDVKDLSFDASGRLWIASPKGLAEFDSAGKWRRTLGLFAPYAFENGDIRKSVLFVPGAYAADTVQPLGGDRLLVQRGGDAPMVLDIASGRFAPLGLGNAYFIQSKSARLLASRPDGTALVQNLDKGASTGLSVYAPDGTFVRRLPTSAASAAVWDSSGRLFLAVRDAIIVLDARDKEIAKLEEPGATRLAISRDGQRLFVLKAQGATLALCQRGSDGRFVRSGEIALGTPASSLAASPSGSVLVGFREAASSGGALVREYSVRDGVPKIARDLVTAPAAASAGPSLDGPTQLKVFNGGLYFLSEGKLVRFVPGGSSAPKIVFDPKFANGAADAFAFSPEGDLYLASQRQGSKPGLNLYRCRKAGDSWGTPEYLNGGKPLLESGRAPTDLEVDREGRVVMFGKSPKPPARLRGEALALFRWDPRSKAEPEFLFELGAPQVTLGEGGLHLMTDGGWLVAGGNTRTITRLGADDKILWQIHREKSMAPGYPDLRCPLGITADSNGDVWVSDPTRHHLLKLDGQTGRLVQTLGSFGDSADTTRLALNQPVGLVATKDGAGKEWLTILSDRRLVAFQIAR